MLKQSASIDRVFRALSDPSRRSIVERLSRGPTSVSDLAEPLPMSLPAVLQHLQVLEESGLVRSEKVGRVRTCSIEVAALRPAERWIQQRGRVGNDASTGSTSIWPRQTTTDPRGSEG